MNIYKYFNVIIVSFNKRAYEIHYMSDKHLFLMDIKKVVKE